jgi:DNA-binding winged helix-turn-helix (wHTH) protein/tetratricopeptide (TPR) repeat protein
MLYLGPFRLDSERLLLSVGKHPLPLGPKVVRTLLAFAQRPGEVLTKRELLDSVWPEGFVEEGNLAQNVYVLRKVLRAHWTDCIQTVPRRGYLFSGAVSASPPHRPHAVRWQYLAAAAAFAISLSFTLVQGTARSGQESAGLSANGQRLFAMGTYYWKQRTQDGVQKSVRYFRSVIKTDPGNARGYAALAQAYAIEGDYGYASMKKSYATARAIARTALKLDPKLSEAHAAMGIAEDLPGTRRAAREQYRTAIALDPGYAAAHQWYGSALVLQGRAREGFVELRKAAQLDPVSPAGLVWLSDAAYLSRRYADAVAYAHEAADLSPQRPDVYVSMGLAYEALRNFSAAEREFHRYAVLCPGCRSEAAALLAHAYALAGDVRTAGSQLAAARTGRAPADPGDVALALIAMNRRGAALAMLRTAGQNARMAVDPRFDAVRGDGRFKKYLKLPA